MQNKKREINERKNDFVKQKGEMKIRIKEKV